MEALKTAFETMDFSALVPDLGTVLGWVELLLRICVMAGPILVLGFGLLFLLAPPKEANYGLGFRCWWGMASLAAWQFTQRLAGMVWSALGAVMTIVMALLCMTLENADPMEMAVQAGIYLLWELGFIVLSVICINVVVILLFDKDGYRRGEE